MTDQPVPPPEPIRQNTVPTGRGGRWSGHPDVDGPVPAAEPYQPPARRRPTSWPKTGTVGASTTLGDDEQPVTVPARAYDAERDATVATVADAFDVPRDLLAPPEPPTVDFTKPGFGIVTIDEARSWGIKIPPAVELLAMADDLNAHGGLDERFVAELLRAAVNDTPPPEQPAEPLTYRSMIVILEQLGVLRPALRPNVADLTGDRLAEIAEQHVNVGPRPDAVADALAEQDRQARVVHEFRDDPGTLVDAITGPWISAEAWARATTPRPWWRRALDRIRQWTR